MRIYSFALLNVAPHHLPATLNEVLRLSETRHLQPGASEVTMKRSLGNLLYSAWEVLCIHSEFWLSTLFSQLSLRLQGCPPASGLRTSGACRFKARHVGSIKIGRHATMLAHWRTNRVGMSSPCLLTTMDQGRIHIGDHFGASAVVLSSRALIQIGHHVLLGGNVRIYDHDHHSLDASIRRTQEDGIRCLSKSVQLGDDVFVGADSIILKGVTLGNRVIVGAGSVVTRSFPDDTIIAGNPARKIN